MKERNTAPFSGQDSQFLKLQLYRTQNSGGTLYMPGTEAALLHGLKNLFRKEVGVRQACDAEG